MSFNYSVLELAAAIHPNIRLGESDVKIRLPWKMQKKYLQNIESVEPQYTAITLVNTVFLILRLQKTNFRITAMELVLLWTLMPTSF